MLLAGRMLGLRPGRGVGVASEAEPSECLTPVIDDTPAPEWLAACKPLSSTQPWQVQRKK